MSTQSPNPKSTKTLYRSGLTIDFVCVIWGSPAKQKYARAVNYLDQEAHGFVITVGLLCYPFLLLPFRRAICLDATAIAYCTAGVTNLHARSLIELCLLYLTIDATPHIHKRAIHVLTLMSIIRICITRKYVTDLSWFFFFYFIESLVQYFSWFILFYVHWKYWHELQIFPETKKWCTVVNSNW